MDHSKIKGIAAGDGAQSVAGAYGEGGGYGLPKENDKVAKQAIWVMLKAKPGKEQEVEAFLQQGAQMANAEPKTVTWFGVKMGPGTYGVFDTFEDEAGRDAHMGGEIAKALMAKAPELFSNELRIETMEILAAK